MAQQEVSLSDLVAHLATVKITTFKAVTGLLFALSVLSVIGRVGIRVYARKMPSADDYFIFFGIVSLIASTGVLYANLNYMYIVQVLYVDPTIAMRVHSPDLIQAITHFMAYQHASSALMFTAIFAVKFSFLAFFWQLIQSVDNIQKYYWSVVVLTFASWLFVCFEPFILCHHFGLESVKCSVSYNSTMYSSMIGLITALDAVTDLMIVSIPILVLRQARMKTRQKAAIGSFMCLSLVMIALAIARASKMRGVVATDIVYELFLQYIEAAVALLMGSLTAYRTFFVTQRERTKYQERMKKPSYSFRRYPFRKQGKGDMTLDEEGGLPEVPRATMTGMWTFIRHNNRTTAEVTVDSHSPQMTLKSKSEQDDSDMAQYASNAFITKPGFLDSSDSSLRQTVSR